MSERLHSELVAEKAIVHKELPGQHALFEEHDLGLREAISAYQPPVAAAALPNLRQDVDRTFEMPTALYATTVALYLGFIAVLGFGLSTPGLALPMAIFAFFIVALFAAPALWLKAAPVRTSKPKTIGQLMQGGIATHTGLLKGRDAVVQMMILPVLIVAWGMTVLVIAGIVAA
ncbi:hypothetical protein [Alteriqipengyuania sp. 357]